MKLYFSWHHDDSGFLDLHLGRVRGGQGVVVGRVFAKWNPRGDNGFNYLTRKYTQGDSLEEAKKALIDSVKETLKDMEIVG